MLIKKTICFIMLILICTSCAQKNDTNTNISQEPAPSAESTATEPAPAEPEQEPEQEPEPPKKGNLEIASALLEGYKQQVSNPPQINAPDYNFSGVKNVRMVAPITGEYSVNKTKTNYDVYGTDLGVPVYKDGVLYLAFGDTFSETNFNGNWRSNVMGYTTDTDYSDGITFESMILIKNNMAKELIKSKKRDNDEMTTIPTGGIAANGAMYLSFMSVKHWGDPGEWECNYGSVAKSVDNGQKWEILTNLKWPTGSGFEQMCPVIAPDGETVYVWGITGGRSGPTKLMKTTVSKYESFEDYEYLVGYSDDQNPIWEKNAIDKAYSVLPPACGELSAMYSEHLQEWVIVYLSGANIIIRSAKEPWGPYTRPVTLVYAKDYPGLYGGFVHPQLTSDGGKKMYFIMSLWEPIYNSVLMECELVKKSD